MKRSHNFQDLTGQTFGRLTALRFDGYRNRDSWFLCQCECGKEKSIRARNLKKGQTQSCGCYHDDFHLYINHTHGMTKTPIHAVWLTMRQRCNDVNLPTYLHYGGRGIKVCERWQHSFENFYTDMGPRPTPKHTLERIDNDGPYSPENCCWSTRKEQANNRRSCHLVTYNDKTQNLTQWSEETGIKMGTLWHRIVVAQMPLDKAFTKGRVPRRKKTES